MRIVALILMALTLLAVSGCASGKPRWEYKTLRSHATPLVPGMPAIDDLQSKHFAIAEAELDKLGEEGWELVATVPEIETTHPNFGNSEYVTGLQPNVRSCAVTLIFKRPWTSKPAASPSPSPTK